MKGRIALIAIAAGSTMLLYFAPLPMLADTDSSCSTDWRDSNGKCGCPNGQHVCAAGCCLTGTPSPTNNCPNGSVPGQNGCVTIIGKPKNESGNSAPTLTAARKRTLARKKKTQQKKEAQAAAAKAAKTRADRNQALAYLNQGVLHLAEDYFFQRAEGASRNLGDRMAYAAVEKLLAKSDVWEDQSAAVAKVYPQVGKNPPPFLCAAPPSKYGSRPVAIEPEDPCISISNGLIREALGNKKGALESYSHAIAVAPNIWLAYAYRGILHIEMGDCPDGAGDLKKAISLNALYKLQAPYYLNQCPAPAAPSTPPQQTPDNPFPEGLGSPP